MAEYWRDFKYEQERTIKAARELCYDKSVIERLENAKTEFELDRIMKTARQNLMEEDLKRWKG